MDYISTLTEKEQVDAFSVLENKENGQFDRIRWKPWEKKIFEVYFYKHNRIFYVMVSGEDIYLLHACRKQKNKTEKKDAELVKKRAAELEAMLGKKFI